MNKKNIITILLALVAVAGTSDAFNFRIDHEDVAIAVNKDIAGNSMDICGAGSAFFTRSCFRIGITVRPSNPVKAWSR